MILPKQRLEKPKSPNLREIWLLVKIYRLVICLIICELLQEGKYTNFIQDLLKIYEYYFRSIRH